MIDIFKDYTLQREELLARIAQELELDSTRIKRMEQAYNKVYDVLKRDDIFFKELEVELYAQGSVRIQTTVKPINGEDFDLDTVLHIYELYDRFEPSRVYNALVSVIENDAYYKSICEKKDRCIRLNFKGDFHIDILPGCMATLDNRNQIAIPEKKLQTWSSGNPRGFGNWFLDNAKSADQYLLKSISESWAKAEVDAEPLPDTNLYSKTPLQRSVQLVKRYRDIFFDKKEFKVSSVVLTTLMGTFYNSEQTIYDTIDNCLTKIKLSYNTALEKGTRFKVLNPVDDQEDFTDSWTNENYRNFYAFIEDFYQKWVLLKQEFEKSGAEYIRLFGEGEYKKSLQDQIKVMSRFSKDKDSTTSGLILNRKAHTDSSGTINPNKGIKNERHHNFGRK